MLHRPGSPSYPSPGLFYLLACRVYVLDAEGHVPVARSVLVGRDVPVVGEFQKRLGVASAAEKRKREPAFGIVRFPVKGKTDHLGVEGYRFFQVADPYHGVKIFHLAGSAVCPILPMLLLSHIVRCSSKLKPQGCVMENSTFSPFSASWTTDVVSDKIQKLRLRLLDLGYRNPLLATRFSGRSNSYIRVVDELPDVLFSRLSSQSQFIFKSLPQLEDNPWDEETEEFQNALAGAQINDEEYAEILKNLDPSDENAFVEEKEAERTLRDRVRRDLGMPLRQKTTDHHSLVQHARNNGISPSYELPIEEERSADGRHEDDYIQTLLLPEVLERTASRLISKNRSWQQETGINVMQAAFGFLEWKDPENNRRNFSPLILLPVVVEKKRTGRGSVEFCVRGTEDPSEGNKVIAEKLFRDFDIELPRYQTGSSIESYMAEVARLSQMRITHWRVRRYVAFGVFPSVQLAMYHDLDIERERIHPNHIVGRILGATAGSSSDSSDISLFAEDYEVDTPRIESRVSVLVDNADFLAVQRHG